ncbi:MAG: NAD(P)H-dependent oxidoreductase [Endomicrobia bacterium]|nr:NAD(P)H-dependent oxidoreductase [Bacillota bacterium]MCL1971403.1 NAD(P)H-dependent oxidoreductase [Endomicrobiia bacterium]
MKTLLYIKANPKTDKISRTFGISQKFIEAYKKNNPEDKIIALDLYKENISFLTSEQAAGHAAEPDEKNIMIKYAKQFADSDKFIFAAPLWNLGLPSIVKAYIDYVTVKGITFKYTEKGAVGLLSGKKAAFITTRGGFYSEPPMSEFENGSRYLKTILGFLGISDYTLINADGLDVIGQNVEKIIAEAVDKAVKLAEIF